MPNKQTLSARLVDFGNRLLEHWRLLLIVLGIAMMVGGTLLNSTIEFKDTIPVTAHYERYSVSGRRRGTSQITLYFTDHEPLSFGYGSRSQQMRQRIALIPPGEELTMRLHPVTHEVLALKEDDRTHFTFDQSQNRSNSAAAPTGVGFFLIALGIWGRKRQ